MSKFSFRIGTKLGLTTGAGVVLVAGMLANQLIGNDSIASSSQKVVINASNKADAQSAEAAMLRAQLDALEIAGALSTERLDKGMQALRAHLAAAPAAIGTAGERALRPEAKQLFRDIGA